MDGAMTCSLLTVGRQEGKSSADGEPQWRSGWHNACLYTDVHHYSTAAQTNDPFLHLGRRC